MPSDPPLARVIALIGALSATGCSGVLDAPQSAGGGRSTSTDSIAGQQGALACGDRTIGVTPLRHLTRAQYVRTVADLLGVSVDPHSVPADDNTQGFDVGTSLSALLIEAYADSAARVAKDAALAKLLPCKLEAINDACVDGFVASFARRAFRRAITAEDKSALRAVFDAGKSAANAEAGIRLVIEAVLQTPSFLYHVEQTAPDDAAGMPRLAAFALANRLSYLIWGSLPDAALLDAAERGELDTDEGLTAQVSRMVDEQRALAQLGFRDFYRQWLSLEQLDDLARDKAVYPSFQDSMGPTLRSSLEKQIDEIAFANTPLVDELLLGTRSYANGQIAGLFGAKITGDALQEVALDPAQRRGILGHPGLLAILAKPNQSAPVVRGKFVREQLLCQRLTPPPADVATTPPDPKPGLTTRERFAQHTADARCASCHRLTDQIGFGLEQFDALGQFRTLDQGKPVDASGELWNAGDATTTAFVGAAQLAEQLAGSDIVRDCVATHYFRFAIARTESVEDGCSLQRAQHGLLEQSGDLRALILAIVKSDAFRFRRSS